MTEERYYLELKPSSNLAKIVAIRWSLWDMMLLPLIVCTLYMILTSPGATLDVIIMLVSILILSVLFPFIIYSIRKFLLKNTKILLGDRTLKIIKKGKEKVIHYSDILRIEFDTYDIHGLFPVYYPILKLKNGEEYHLPPLDKKEFEILSSAISRNNLQHLYKTIDFFEDIVLLKLKPDKKYAILISIYAILSLLCSYLIRFQLGTILNFISKYDTLRRMLSNFFFDESHFYIFWMQLDTFLMLILFNDCYNCYKISLYNNEGEIYFV